MAGYNKEGIHKETGTKYNKEGYDRKGYNKGGYNIYGEKKVEKITPFKVIFKSITREKKEENIQEKKVEKKKIVDFKDNKTNEIKEKCKYNLLGYDENGYDKEGYDIFGYNKLGFSKDKIHKFTQTRYNREGYDYEGYNEDGYNREGKSKFRNDKKILIVKEEKLESKINNNTFKTMEEKTESKVKNFSKKNSLKTIKHKVSSLKIKEINIEKTEVIMEVKSRRGHIEFKNNLLAIDKKCKICGLNNINLLVASHIKPWRVATDEEKVDYNNGFLLCPNHDSVFDKGLISFEDDGKIMLSSFLTIEDRKILQLDENIKIKLSQKNREYLKYHREYIFKK